ncbi:universal stress protein [Streptomyces sp. NBC_00503]|uniref:universal stress protein n=1 Tax=Streptomyces sp. NBC_00503 TaxID=2903659 RepID=UPI003FCD0D39
MSAGHRRGRGHRSGPELGENQRTRLQPFLTRHYPGVTVEAVVAPGDPAGRLVTASQRADLIVVGRHRRRLRAGSLLMGSVSNAVLLHALCPVAVVPVGAEDPSVPTPGGRAGPGRRIASVACRSPYNSSS